MQERHKETAFLRRIMGLRPTDESHKLEQRIRQLHLDARSVRRAMGLMVLSGALALACLAYGELLVDNLNWLVVEVLYVIGLAAVISLAVLVGHLIAYRYLLNAMREECRELVIKLFEFHLATAESALLRENLKKAGEAALAQGSAESRSIPESITARQEPISPGI